MNTKLLCLLLAAFLVVVNCQNSGETIKAGVAAAGNQAQGQGQQAGPDVDNDPEEQADGMDLEESDVDIESELESEIESEVEESDVEEPEIMAGGDNAAAETAAGQSSGNTVVANQAAAAGQSSGQQQPAAINAAGAPAVHSESAGARALGKTFGLVIGALCAVVVITLVAVYVIRQNRLSQGSPAYMAQEL